MADYQYPNRIRAYTAFLIYRDAMIPFIEAALGPSQIRLTLFNDDVQGGNHPKYDTGIREIDRNTLVSDLIDQADIPFLVGGNRKCFPGLASEDVDRMYSIHLLWNDKIKHLDDLGDINPEDAAECAILCARVLRRCGLDEAADEIASPSASAAAGASLTTEDDLREQRERREWDKERLATKPTESLTAWEQQRLAEIEWEEEWDRRELLRRESEEIARIGQDVDALRHWFNADAGRSHHHASVFADLEHAEDTRLGREHGEVARIGRDVDALRTWFNADTNRQYRHVSQFANLEREEQERLDYELDDLVLIGRDIDALQNWFNADDGRKQRHLSDFELLDREQRAQRREVALYWHYRLASGRSHNLVLSEYVSGVRARSIACWGDNEYGQCDAPTGQFIAVSAGYQHSVALRDDGKIICWGNDKNDRCDAPAGGYLLPKAVEATLGEMAVGEQRRSFASRIFGR